MGRTWRRQAEAGKKQYPVIQQLIYIVIVDAAQYTIS
jgi:hypothetical protein